MLANNGAERLYTVKPYHFPGIVADISMESLSSPSAEDNVQFTYSNNTQTTIQRFQRTNETSFSNDINRNIDTNNAIMNFSTSCEGVINNDNNEDNANSTECTYNHHSGNTADIQQHKETLFIKQGGFHGNRDMEGTEYKQRTDCTNRKVDKKDKIGLLSEKENMRGELSDTRGAIIDTTNEDSDISSSVISTDSDYISRNNLDTTANENTVCQVTISNENIGKQGTTTNENTINNEPASNKNTATKENNDFKTDNNEFQHLYPIVNIRTLDDDTEGAYEINIQNLYPTTLSSYPVNSPPLIDRKCQQYIDINDENTSSCNKLNCDEQSSQNTWPSTHLMYKRDNIEGTGPLQLQHNGTPPLVNNRHQSMPDERQFETADKERYVTDGIQPVDAETYHSHSDNVQQQYTCNQGYYSHGYCCYNREDYEGCNGDTRRLSMLMRSRSDETHQSSYSRQYQGAELHNHDRGWDTRMTTSEVYEGHRRRKRRPRKLPEIPKHQQQQRKELHLSLPLKLRPANNQPISSLEIKPSPPSLNQAISTSSEVIKPSPPSLNQAIPTGSEVIQQPPCLVLSLADELQLAMCNSAEPDQSEEAAAGEEEGHVSTRHSPMEQGQAKLINSQIGLYNNDITEQGQAQLITSLHNSIGGEGQTKLITSLHNSIGGEGQTKLITSLHNSIGEEGQTELITSQTGINSSVAIHELGSPENVEPPSFRDSGFFGDFDYNAEILKQQLQIQQQQQLLLRQLYKNRSRKSYNSDCDSGYNTQDPECQSRPSSTGPMIRPVSTGPVLCQRCGSTASKAEGYGVSGGRGQKEEQEDITVQQQQQQSPVDYYIDDDVPHSGARLKEKQINTHPYGNRDWKSERSESNHNDVTTGTNGVDDVFMNEQKDNKGLDLPPSGCQDNDDLMITHRCCHKFVPRHSDELFIEIGDPIFVRKEDDDLWCEGTNLRTKKSGIFPSVCATDLNFLEGEGDGSCRPVRFYLRLLGSVQVKYPKGTQVLCQAIQKVAMSRRMTLTSNPPAMCCLEITDYGIRLSDKKSRRISSSSKMPRSLSQILGQSSEGQGEGKRTTQQNEFSHFYSLQNVTFCGIHPTNNKYFAFITKHPLETKFACHVLLAEESTSCISEAIGASFKTYYQQYLAATHPTEDIYLEN